MSSSIVTAEDDGFRNRVAEEGRAIRKADAITAPSHDTLEQTRAFYGLALENAEVIPNPVEPASEHWRLDRSDPKLVLFVGRFDGIKCGDLIIDAFGRVVREVPEARLWFIGPDREGITGDGRTWYLRQKAEAAEARKAMAVLPPGPKSSAVV